jgi:hypothetical protein
VATESGRSTGRISGQAFDPGAGLNHTICM